MKTGEISPNKVCIVVRFSHISTSSCNLIEFHNSLVLIGQNLIFFLGILENTTAALVLDEWSVIFAEYDLKTHSKDAKVYISFKSF